MAAAKNAIEIRELKTETIDITIVGSTPLVVHAWSEKAKREMFEKQAGRKTSRKHDIKIPENDFKNSLYWLTDMPEDGKDSDEARANITKAFDDGARFAFPCCGIKQAIIKGAYHGGLDVKMTELRGLFFLEGATEHSTIDLAEIIGPYPEMREDMVRVGGQSKSADIRYRAEFKEWRIPLKLKYHTEGKYTLEQILNMVNFGGFYEGIGEWRPEKDGQFGMFTLETGVEL